MARAFTFSFDEQPFTFRFPQKDDHISKCHAHGSFYEQEFLLAIRGLAVRGTYVDIGAHVGNHSVFFSRLCPAIEVVAFEPSAATFRCLVHNLSVNGAKNVFPFRCAVGAQAGHVALTSTTVGNSGMDRYATASLGVPLLTLDQVISPALAVGLIKVDSEGFELDILRGAKALLRRDRPIVAMEAATERDLAQQQNFFVDECLYYDRSRRYNSTPTYLWTPR